MPIDPVVPDDGAAVWHHQQDGLLALGVWTERRLGHGEDAEPLLVHHVPTGDGVLGVFDGAGGAGASIAYHARDGRQLTGAWLGARVARQSLESWFRAEYAIADGQSRRSMVESLRGRLTEDVTQMRPRNRSKVVGTMRRELPTTMAAIWYRTARTVPYRHAVECEVLWAGDSRAYALTPYGGLRVLTRDHSEETDALEQLFQDPPLTNLICADREFEVEARTAVLDTPVVLICATDGFFGYVETPADFECHLLSALQASSGGLDWARRMARGVTAYTGDDASLGLVAFGHDGFADLQGRFKARTEYLLQCFADDRSDQDGDRDALQRWRSRTWSEYRPGYEVWMPGIGGDWEGRGDAE